MDNSFKVPDLLAGVADRMWSELSEALIPHPGELGTNREEVVRRFLQSNLPQRFRVSTGFVFDSRGNVSKQIDVIIFDEKNCPRFETAGGKLFFPCEGVVCVGQIKSSLSSRDSVHDALENLRSVKVLDRSAGGSNVALHSGANICQDHNHLDQIFGFVFVSGECLQERNMRDAFFEHLCEHGRRDWINVIFSFDKYLLTFVCDKGVCPDPLDAYAIGSITDRPRAELFVHFFIMISRAVTAISVASFSYWDYLHSGGQIPIVLSPFEKFTAKHTIPDHVLGIPTQPTNNG